MPQARTNPMNESNTCCSVAGVMVAFVNSHCSSRARRRSKPSLTGARTSIETRLARKESCRSSSRSKRRGWSNLRKRRSSPSVESLSKMINSTPGRIAVISLASSLPMIHVNRVAGHAWLKACNAAAAWHVSPMAERRSKQTRCGGGSKRCDIGLWSLLRTRSENDTGRRPTHCHFRRRHAG